MNLQEDFPQGGNYSFPGDASRALFLSDLNQVVKTAAAVTLRLKFDLISLSEDIYSPKCEQEARCFTEISSGIKFQVI